MGFDCILPEILVPFAELYEKHDPVFLIQTESLMPYERYYVRQLVAIIVCTLTETHMDRVTPTSRAIVYMSWDSLSRLGIKLPVLDKLVAASQKPTAEFEARKATEEAVKSWPALSDESKEVELRNIFNIDDSQRQILDEEVEQIRQLLATKEEELQTSLDLFNEKLAQRNYLATLKWCTFP